MPVVSRQAPTLAIDEQVNRLKLDYREGDRWVYPSQHPTEHCPAMGYHERSAIRIRKGPIDELVKSSNDIVCSCTR